MTDPGTQLTLDDVLYIETNGEEIEISDNSSAEVSISDGAYGGEDCGGNDYLSW